MTINTNASEIHYKQVFTGVSTSEVRLIFANPVTPFMAMVPVHTAIHVGHVSKV